MGSQFGEKVGSYELLRSLGKGGFGEVFEATHELTRQRVALKLLLPDNQQNQEIARRFLQEAEVLAQLQHPGIVRILSCERLPDKTTYIAMEYLEGQTLHAWMREQPGHVSLEAALAIGQQIAEAMTAVHAKGIIHRDLKPGNVFLVPDATLTSGQQVKILDFGIAKVPRVEEIRPETQLATDATKMLGTEGYMAPEQYEGPDHTVKPSDVYALGLLLFEMIAGQRPFTAETSVELMLKHRQDEPPSLQKLVPTTPAALSTFISSMLAKEPAQRPTMLRAQEKLARPWEIDQNECLLPGLEPFSGDQAELFFGRQTESQEILTRLVQARTGERRWIQIEGQSGVGKTSLVQAGVLPRLEEQRLPDGRSCWRVVRLRPSEDPIRSLSQALFSAYDGPGFELTQDDIERSLREDDQEALTKLAKAHARPSELLLLVVEQMEELFALAAASPRFDALVSTALAEPDSPVRMLSTMRRDFLHRLGQAPKLAALLDHASRYLLLPMEEAQLTQVVQGMVRRVGLRLSEGLAASIIRDAADAESRLPLLGYTLHELWTPEREVITHEHYEASGGASGALTRHAKMLLEGLGEEGRERAKWLILDLVQVGRGVPDTHRPRTMQEVLSAAGDDTVTEKVLMHLAGKSLSPSTITAHNLRLIKLSDDPALDSSSQRVALVHETLLREERTIARWIDEERPRLERHADLEVAAQAWERAGSPTTEGLPSGSLLDHYRLHTEDRLERERSRRMASARARRFLQEAERLSLRGRRRVRALWVATALGVATILFFAVVARKEQERAEESLLAFIKMADKIASDTDWQLSRISHTLALRQEIQRDMDAKLASMLLRYPTNIDVRNLAIDAKQRRSDSAREDESLSRARQLLEESKNYIDLGLAADRENKSLQKRLGLYYSKLGKIELARGDLEAAQRNFNAARQLPVSLDPISDDPDGVRTRATNHSEQGNLELAMSRPSQALPMYERAIALMMELVTMKDEDYNRSLLSEALRASAKAAHAIGDPASLEMARDRIEEALQLQEPIARMAPGNTYYSWTLARIYLERAELLFEEGQLDAAVDDYEVALRLGRELHEADPTRKPYGLVLGESLLGCEKLGLCKEDLAGTKKAQRERLAHKFLSEDGEDNRFKNLLHPENR